VSRAGFRSAVREWLPEGATLPGVKLSIASSRLFPPGSAHTVTFVRLHDGEVRRRTHKADDEGRLQLELDGDAWEVGIGAGPLLTAVGHRVEEAAWATAGRPVKLRVRFLNKGAARSATATVKWESPTEGVTNEPADSRLFSLGPGEFAEVPLTVTAADPARPVARLIAVEGPNRTPVDVPLLPPAAPATDFVIADGRTFPVWRRAVKLDETALGEGNGDGHAAPGEQFAVLLRDRNGFRAAELFTNHPCVDNSARASDVWSEYDHVGASAKYSLPVIKPECADGTVVRMLARVVLPDKPVHKLRHASIELPVRWKRP
jgi:hypothetical protein